MRGVTATEELAWNAAALAEPVVEPAVAVWTYLRPAVVLGAAQRPTVELVARAAAASIELVQRPTGGGAVLAGPWLLAASVVLPPGDPRVGASIRASYRWLGLTFVDWLGAFGIDARLVAGLGRSSSWACFGVSSPGEVAVGPRKIVGLAQARRRQGVLLSAGALVAPPPWGVLCDVMGRPAADAADLAGRTTSVAQLAIAPLDELAAELSMRLATVLGPACLMLRLSP